MKHIAKLFIATILVLGQFQCIDPLEVQPSKARRILVVEGGISTQPGPHLIEISKSAQYGSRQVDEIRTESEATVWIRDQTGDQVFLQEIKDGNYTTPAGWRAKVGSSYTLLIELANGENYSSLPETIVPVPPLEEIVPIFKKEPSVDDVSPVVGLELYARWQDPADEANFYMWDTRGEYRILTYPQNHIGRDFFGNPFPDPLDCCEICFIKEEKVNRQLRIFKDNFSNGTLQNEVMSFVEDDGGRFQQNYMAVIDHSSLTKSAFQFFDVLKNQLSISGDIFDPPTATIRGNILNLDNPDETTIGYFRASDTQRDTVFLSNSLLTEPAPMRIINDDCRILNNSTTTKPPYWPG